jgi:hypothetical protein
MAFSTMKKLKLLEFTHCSLAHDLNVCMFEDMPVLEDLKLDFDGYTYISSTDGSIG